MYEVRKPNPDNPNDSYGLPTPVSSAFARILDGLSGEFIEIGGPGVLTETVTITQPTGTTASDKGAILTYKVKSDHTQEPGDYTLLITAVFQDGSRLTEDRRYKILEFR